VKTTKNQPQSWITRDYAYRTHRLHYQYSKKQLARRASI